MKRLLSTILIASTLPLTAQDAGASVAQHLRSAATRADGWPFARVVHDTGPDGSLWSCGATWKAAFDGSGFTYLPRLGAEAPSAPLHFRLLAVRVGGRPLPLGDLAMPMRAGDVVAFHHGAVRETYTLHLDHVEQGFVIDTTVDGDVDVEFAVTTTLTECADEPGLQFANAHGRVDYGAAFLRRGAELVPITTTWNGASIRLHVDAAQRGPGPVVIDPILSTRTSSASGPMESPDITYDAARDRYLVIWESQISATDHDVISEQFDGAGDPIAGSLAPIEISGLLATHPRCAHLPAGDAHLVVFALTDPNAGNRRMIYSRRVDAATSVVGSYELLSDPNLPGHNEEPVIGTDPATGPATPHDWLVVWRHVESATDNNVLGRAVLANGQPKHSWVLVIEDGVGTINQQIQVSRSNGNGHVPHAMWLVVYSRQVSVVADAVMCRTLDLGFVLGPEVPLDVTNRANRRPQASSPIADGNRSTFLVTYQRGSIGQSGGVLVGFAPTPALNAPIDLTAQFGMTGELAAVATDGVRFVTLCKSQTSQDLVARTFGFAANLVLHDGPVPLGGATGSPALLALRDTGGPVAGYGMAWLQIAPVGPIRVVRYAGQQAGPTTQNLATACHGLGLQAGGTPALGGRMQFALQNVASDFPGFAFGTPASNPVPICATCSLGLRPDLPISLSLGAATFAIDIPPVAGLVGQPFAVQGVGIGPWTCLGALRFSDTVAFTIR